MTHEETIKRIQGLTGGMELEFGCEVMYEWENGEKSKMVVVGKIGEDFILTDYQSSFCDDANETNFEILGKPITLAVTIMAVNKSQPKIFGAATVDNQLSMTEPLHRDLLRLVRHWNLSKDNFNDQSEETKTFIGGLLGN